MSFWSKFGKVLSIAGPIAAMPFTGGASALGLAGVGAAGATKSILDIAGKVAPALGAISGGRAQGRVDESAINQRQDQINQQRYGNEINAAHVNLGAGQDRASQSVTGDILKNAQDFKFSDTFGGGSTGGLRPSIFSDETRQLGGVLSSQALTAQGTNDGRAVEPPPALTELPQSGKLDSFLNVAGSLGSLASLIPYRRQQPVGTPPLLAPFSSNVRMPTFGGRA